MYTPALRAGLQWQPICRVTSEWCCIRSACSLLWWRSENVILTVSHSRGEIKPQYAVLFVLYILAILVVTLITRQTRTETVLQTELFASVKSFLLEGDVEELNHMILNVVMFMPLGYLFVQMHPRKLGDAAQVLGIGVMLSTIIESCQLIFRLGNCDVDDILANTFGALLGLVLYKIVHHSSRK